MYGLNESDNMIEYDKNISQSLLATSYVAM